MTEQYLTRLREAAREVYRLYAEAGEAHEKARNKYGTPSVEESQAYTLRTRLAMAVEYTESALRAAEEMKEANK